MGAVEDVICRVLLETLDKMANFEVLPRSRGEGSGQVIMRRLASTERSYAAAASALQVGTARD
eukprot:scaffold39551_cov57-Phaeocystis_antarctica.AAC.6